MRHRSVAAASAVAVLTIAVLAAPATGATIKYSENGGGQQIWITADSFASRSMDGGVPNWVIDPEANDVLGGGAYCFYDDVIDTTANQLPWWAQFEIPSSAVPGTFNVSGAWRFWIRTQMPVPADPNDPVQINADADWLFSNGHPTDLNVSNPTEADWATALAARDNLDDRVAQDVWGAGGIRPSWVWRSSDASGNVWQKQLAMIDGKLTFRLYEREAGPYNARIDVIVWSNNPDYTPTDDDFRAALPEPTTLALLAAGLVAASRRRR